MSWALLLGLIAAYAWYVRGGGVARGTGRIARYRRWLRRAPLAFGASALLALAISGRLDSVAVLPPEFAALAATAGAIAGFGGDLSALLAAVVGGLAGGTLIGILLSRWRMRRGKRPVTAGNIDSILPRRGSEFGWSALLGTLAGLVEELYFRLALPLVATVATGSAAFGFALAALLFAGAHRYQGGAGIAFSGLVGLLLTLLYLATGELWVAMLVHVLLNLNGLVLRPALLRPKPAG